MKTILGSCTTAQNGPYISPTAIYNSNQRDTLTLCRERSACVVTLLFEANIMIIKLSANSTGRVLCFVYALCVCTRKLPQKVLTSFTDQFQFVLADLWMNCWYRNTLFLGQTRDCMTGPKFGVKRLKMRAKPSCVFDR